MKGFLSVFFVMGMLILGGYFLEATILTDNKVENIYEDQNIMERDYNNRGYIGENLLKEVEVVLNVLESDIKKHVINGAELRYINTELTVVNTDKDGNFLKSTSNITYEDGTNVVDTSNIKTIDDILGEKVEDGDTTSVYNNDIIKGSELEYKQKEQAYQDSKNFVKYVIDNGDYLTLIYVEKFYILKAVEDILTDKYSNDNLRSSMIYTLRDVTEKKDLDYVLNYAEEDDELIFLDLPDKSFVLSMNINPDVMRETKGGVLTSTYSEDFKYRTISEIQEDNKLPFFESKVGAFVLWLIFIIMCIAGIVAIGSISHT